MTNSKAEDERKVGIKSRKDAGVVEEEGGSLMELPEVRVASTWPSVLC